MASGAVWRLTLTDSQYRPIGEILNAGNRRVTLPLSKIDACSFSVSLDNPLADVLLAGDGYVKAYRNGYLHFYGPIVAAEEAATSTSASVAITCAGAGWILSKRLAGKSALGQRFTDFTDRAQIVKTLVDISNAEGESGIDTSVLPMSAGSSSTYQAGPYRPIMDIVSELGAAADGFDWRIIPYDNFSGGSVISGKIGLFYATDVIGEQRPEAVFEFGMGTGNVASYNRALTRDQQANRVYHIASAGPDAPGYPVVSALDAVSVSRWKLMEDLAQADISDLNLRNQLVQAHVNVRANPREIITFQPVVTSDRVPDYGADFAVGDWVPARAAYRKAVRFNGMFRVWGVDFAIDDNNMETMNLTLSEDG